MSRRKVELPEVTVYADIPNSEDVPEMSLWLAVLRQAVSDLMAPVPSAAIHRHKRACPKGCRALSYSAAYYAQKSALQWLNSRDDANVTPSFAWICSLINVDAATARAAILTRYNNLEQLRGQ